MAEAARPSERDAVRLRFLGGPLDGQEHAAKVAADVYRMVGGEYRGRAGDEADGAAVYEWRPDTVSWHEGVPAASDA